REDAGSLFERLGWGRGTGPRATSRHQAPEIRDGAFRLVQDPEHEVGRGAHQLLDRGMGSAERLLGHVEVYFDELADRVGPASEPRGRNSLTAHESPNSRTPSLP